MKCVQNDSWTCYFLNRRGEIYLFGNWGYLACSFLLGCVCILEYPLIAGILFLALLLKLIIQKQFRLIIYSVSIFLLAIGVTSIHEQMNTTYQMEGKVEGRAIRFLDVPSIDGNRLSANVQISKGEIVSFVYFFQTLDEKLNHSIRSGTVCLAKGDLVKPSEPRNENAFNYEKYLYHNKIHWIYEATHLTNCMDDQMKWIDSIHNTRHTLLDQIDDNYPQQLIPYAKALLFGDRQSFDEEIYTSYQKLGIVHLLAISGLHVGLFVGMLYYVLLRIGLTREQIFYFFLVFLPIYSLLCGANPPVLRASAMTLFLLSNTHFKLRFTSLDTLAISLIIFLLYNPYLLFHIGFQLSYIVSFSIIASTQILHHTTYLQLSLYISIISLLCSIPIMTYHFYEVSMISVISNLFFVPLYSFLFVPLFIITFICSYFSTVIFNLLTEILLWFVILSEKMIALAGKFPFATIVFGKPHVLWLAGCTMAIIYLFIRWERSRSLIRSSIPVVVILFGQIVSPIWDHTGEVIFIDVGQGDSILIRLPYNRGTYLIDTGGVFSFIDEEWKKRKNPYEVGKKVVIPLLKSKGITEIDKLILTHGHFDHIGAATELLDELKVKEIMIPPNAWKEKEVKQIILKSLEKNVTVRQVMAGESWSNRSGTFQFISPIGTNFDSNNSSLVLHAQFGGYTWLFTGDMEKEAEQELLDHSIILHADVLKVGHHGSNTSTIDTFLKEVAPKYAVISVGQNNRYNHPSKEVIERLKENNVRILRTDQHGAVHYEFTHQRGTVLGDWRILIADEE